MSDRQTEYEDDYTKGKSDDSRERLCTKLVSFFYEVILKRAPWMMAMLVHPWNVLGMDGRRVLRWLLLFISTELDLDKKVNVDFRQESQRMS